MRKLFIFFISSFIVGFIKVIAMQDKEFILGFLKLFLIAISSVVVIVGFFYLVFRNKNKG